MLLLFQYKYFVFVSSVKLMKTLYGEIQKPLYENLVGKCLDSEWPVFLCMIN